MSNILEVNGLVKRYPAFSLDSVSFSLPEGCVTGFIGANGAGKTTTIRSILNLAHKDMGTIKIFGLDAGEHEQEIKDRIGIIMDGSYFYNDLSMRDMKNGGKGVFFSTHITSDLDKIADMLILINGGKIIFQRNKDDLLDTFRTVKGNTAALNDQNKKLIRGLRVSAFGFTGITDQIPEIKKEMSDVLLEKATIEDIMLAYIGGDNSDR